MSSSLRNNLLKMSSTVSIEERVIDYNEIIKAKIQTILDTQDSAAANPNNFVSGLNVDVVEELLTDSDDAEANAQNRAMAVAQANIDSQMAQAKNMQDAAEKMLADAKKKSDAIESDARTQSMMILNNAREQGYQEGIKQAEEEIAQHKAQLDAEYNRSKQAVVAEYEQLKSTMEADLVEVLTEVFRKVTLTMAEDNQDILMHLINGVLIIKASPEDYKFLVNNQGKLYVAMNKDVTLDIVEDAGLVHNECFIETDGGVFNCSLDIELNNLIKKIKLLSCV